MNNAINSLNSNTHLSAEEKRRIVEEEAKTLEAFKVTLSCFFRLVRFCLSVLCFFWFLLFYYIDVNRFGMIKNQIKSNHFFKI